MEYLLEWFLLVLSVIIAVRYFYEKKIVKKRSMTRYKLAIPGVKKSHPRLGNLGELSEYGSLHKFLEHLHNEYGSVASFYWQDTLVVSISDNNSFKCVKHLFNRPHLLFENFKSFLGEECIQFANGVESQDRRKCYDQSFTAEAITRYIKTIEREGNETLEALASSTELIIESIQLVGLTMAMKTLLQTCITPDKKDDDFFQKIINLYNIVWDGLMARLIEEKTFKNTYLEDIKFQEAQKEFNSIIRDVVASRMKLLEEESGKKSDTFLIDDMIHFHGDVNSEVIIKDVLVYLIAGFHTSGNLFAWCFYFLAKNPEFQERICEEILQNEINFSNTKECLYSLKHLSFLRACVDETLRLSELATFAGRESNDDIFIGPYFIPANTPIILALGVAHNNPNIFKDAHLFNPSRFLDGTLQSLSFVPFGFAGKRKCPGEKFTYLEVSIWLYQFIKSYRFSLKNPNENVKKVYGLVTHMDRPVSVVFEHR